MGDTRPKVPRNRVFADAAAAVFGARHNITLPIRAKRVNTINKGNNRVRVEVDFIVETSLEQQCVNSQHPAWSLVEHESESATSARPR